MCFPSQAKQEELEELNKELRQCNLQQFIQQTGALPAHTHSRTELQEQLEQLELAHLLQDEYRNGSKDMNKSKYRSPCSAFNTRLLNSDVLPSKHLLFSSAYKAAA